MCTIPAALVTFCAGLWISNLVLVQGLEAGVRPGPDCEVERCVTCLHGGDTTLSPAASPGPGLCKEFLNRFYSSLLTRGIDFSVDTIEKELITFCLDAKGKENRLCYYLGATKDAATKILGEVTRPMSVHVPVVKICERLKKMDSQICELKYEKKLDLASVDLRKMRVAELKQILHSWGEECKACAEKNDYVTLIKELAPKYVKPQPQSEL